MLDLKEQTFGRLTVLLPTSERRNTSVVWKCRCDCTGKIVKVSARHLKEGNTKSCGCLHKEAAKQQGFANKKHGASRSEYKDGSDQLDYVIWTGIKRRCYNKKDPSYKRYGAKGINLCKTWKNSFEKFAIYIRTLENCPSDSVLVSRFEGKRLKVSIDRINNKGNYEVGNIKWSTSKQQARNRKSNVIVEYKGETLTLIDAVEKHSDLPYDVVRERVRRYGWSLEKALKTPSRLS
jgi:hypothetical protein